MMEKIDWYREVLEIEPNSKVFFPLAKLLVKDHMPAEAIATLEKGLERHPEFLEARLLLIELLHRNGEQEACDAQIAKLNEIFTAYAGFWEAWAACLSAKPADADTAAIVRVLAATFIAGPLQLHEVLNRGVSSIIEEKQAKKVMDQDSALPEVQAHDSGSETSANAEIPAEALSGSAISEPEEPINPAADPNLAAVSTINGNEPPAPDLEAADHNLDEQQETVPDDNQETYETISQDQTSADHIDAQPLEASGSGPVDEASLMRESNNESEKPFQDPVTALAAEMGQPMVTDRGDINAAGADDEASEEAFSLRTRSMADVLAAQGDLAGALDIYAELAAAASDPDEQAKLNSRIAELKGEQQSLVQETEAGEQTERLSPGKENLLGMLEALARRVEARVNS